VPAGLVLTGGSSNLAGIEALGRDILRLPVRVGVPTSMSGISDILRDPAHATSVGLLLWGLRHEGRHLWKSRGLLRRFISRIRNLFR
jgi:cell division protein FtsA